MHELFFLQVIQVNHLYVKFYESKPFDLWLNLTKYWILLHNFELSKEKKLTSKGTKINIRIEKKKY